MQEQYFNIPVASECQNVQMNLIITIKVGVSSPPSLHFILFVFFLFFMIHRDKNLDTSIVFESLFDIKINDTFSICLFLLNYGSDDCQGLSYVINYAWSKNRQMYYGPYSFKTRSNYNYTKCTHFTLLKAWEQIK